MHAAPKLVAWRTPVNLRGGSAGANRRSPTLLRKAEYQSISKVTTDKTWVMHTVGQQTAFQGIPLDRQLRFLGTIHSSIQPRVLCRKQGEKLQHNLRKIEA